MLLSSDFISPFSYHHSVNSRFRVCSRVSQSITNETSWNITVRTTDEEDSQLSTLNSQRGLVNRKNEAISQTGFLCSDFRSAFQLLAAQKSSKSMTAAKIRDAMVDIDR
jgi:hypothetical protein